MRVEFTVMGEPQGKGRPRFIPDTGGAYTPEKTATYENYVKVEYIRQCKRYRFGDTDSLRMSIYADYSIAKSTSKKKRALMLAGELLPTKKPDMDNIAKIIADSLNQIAYRDDAQIVELFIGKRFSQIPQVFVAIENIKEF